jgi:hypothetical protein
MWQFRAMKAVTHELDPGKAGKALKEVVATQFSSNRFFRFRHISVVRARQLMGLHGLHSRNTVAPDYAWGFPAGVQFP